MSLGSISSRNLPKYLYTGPETTNSATSPSKDSRPAPDKGGDIVSISDAAKAALAAQNAQPAASGAGSVRDRLNAQYKAATDAGTFISFDSSKGGKWLDLSSFTDDELSQVALNKSGAFSRDEIDLADGALSGRLEYSLRPFAEAAGNGDRRAQATALNALYSKMSDDVRAALGLTPVVMASNNSMLQGDSAKFGWLDLEPITAWLGQAFAEGGLQFDN